MRIRKESSVLFHDSICLVQICAYLDNIFVLFKLCLFGIQSLKILSSALLINRLEFDEIFIPHISSKSTNRIVSTPSVVEQYIRRGHKAIFSPFLLGVCSNLFFFKSGQCNTYLSFVVEINVNKALRNRDSSTSCSFLRKAKSSSKRIIIKKSNLKGN